MPLRNAGAGALLVVVVLAISALVPAPAAAGEGLPAHPPAAPLPAPDLAPDAADPVFIHFDTETAGTRIAEKYASQGLHFLNDYQPSRLYRSSPQIQAHPNARTSPHVLVNDYYDPEFYSSIDVPLVAWTDSLISGVGMHLGTTSAQCSGQATVSLYDCNGFLRGQKTVAVSHAFNTPLQVNVDDPGHPAQMVVIDYGGTSCAEAIDSLAFQPVAGSCTDNLAPIVTVTSHAAAEVSNNAQQILEGYVTETGILKSVKVNGTAAQFYQKEGFYYFRYDAALSNGSNTFTIVAENGSGGKGSAQIVLTLGTPKSASISQFHLTQRGVVKNSSCDVDLPFVAGKPALVRVALDVKTAGGQSTYASGVEMSLWRKGQSTPVETYWGTTYSPFISQFNSPNHMTAIHFWVPAGDLEAAGEYRFTFQPYAGSTKFGAPLTVWCTSSEWFAFAETDPIRLFILPAEAGVNNPNHTPEHSKAFFGLLAAIERTYPIREGVSSLAWPAVNSGVKYMEGAPFRFCDGSAAMEKNSKWCAGTGWEWTFVDKDPGGTLQRTDLAVVNNPRAGTEVAASHTLNFTPQIGIFRGGAHPGDSEQSFPIFDEDHNGTITNADRLYFIKSYFDADNDAGNAQPSWIAVNSAADLNHYDTGERMRFYLDQNGNNQNNEHTGNDTNDAATQAPVVRLWNHAGKVIHGPALEAMNAYNQAAAGSQSDAEFASLWFPILFHPDTGGWRFYGPGSASGKENWIRVKDKSTMAHELGHSLAGLKDLYLASVDPDPDDLVTKENAWAVYVYYQARKPDSVFAVMGVDRDSDDVVFTSNYYKEIYKKLTSAASASSPQAAAARQFIARGAFDAQGNLYELDTTLASGMETTALVRESPYALVFGRGAERLAEHRFPIDRYTHPQGEPEEEPEGGYFNVVVPFPDATEWVELVHDGRRTMARLEVSPSPPRVALLAPNGGGFYGASDQIQVEWEAGDADGDRLVSSLYYSVDGGENWLPVASGLTGSPYLWHLGDVPGAAGGRGLLKVVVTDGFHSAEDQSDQPFGVEGKPPLASILTPGMDAQFLQCEQVRVLGAAVDPEGVLIRTDWLVDGAMAAEILEENLGTLPPGDHHLRLEVEDDQGLVARDEVVVHVLPDADCDTMSDDFELRYGLEPGDARDAGEDGDGDRLLNLDEAWWQTAPDNPDTDGDGISDGEEVERGSDPRDPGDPPGDKQIYLPVIQR